MPKVTVTPKPWNVGKGNTLIDGWVGESVPTKGMGRWFLLRYDVSSGEQDIRAIALNVPVAYSVLSETPCNEFSDEKIAKCAFCYAQQWLAQQSGIPNADPIELPMILTADSLVALSLSGCFAIPYEKQEFIIELEAQLER
jgi:hypothetical protein